MNSAQIENNLQDLVVGFSKETFIYELLLAYGFPKSIIARLKKGTHNLSKRTDQIILKKKLLFQEVTEGDLHATIDALRRDEKTHKHSPRFLIVTDYETLLAVDTKTQDTLDVGIKKIAKYFDFFLPWAGMEKAQSRIENLADIKAAERMAKLFDEIKNDNPNETPEFTHSLNVFLSRLLFCFYAEDTGIFEKGQFTAAIASHTQTDGSDLNTYLEKLFEVLNTEKNKRDKLPVYLEAFPYVNGGLFKNRYRAPRFKKSSRLAIIKSGELDWSAINPDIFGSMIQAVITPEHRGGLGMHYTSVPNIMKVIEPLFLNELYEKFEEAKGNEKQLNHLLKRLKKIKVFDPACGSGNFLIISYKELRRLEMKIFKAANMLSLSEISLTQFYGIEIDDFAHEIATLSLWLAEHQMNTEFFREFGRTKPMLPLQDSGNIAHGNSVRLNWERICPKKEEDEVYILGNPPYLGARLQDTGQKNDMDFLFKENIEGYNNLDYIACWFYKGAQYIEHTNSKCAFVSTNSISQGEQVAILWPSILKDNLEIDFARHSFKWTNNAKGNAGVICIIIGLRNKGIAPKYIYKENLRYKADYINAYLLDAGDIYIQSRRESICNLPKMAFGNMPNDGGHLILNENEYLDVVEDFPKAKPLFKRALGAKEFLNGQARQCIWIEGDKALDFAKSIKPIASRIEAVRKYRLSSDREATRILARIPYRFGEIRHRLGSSIIIPRHSSERREYIPLDFLTEDTIILDSALAVYDATPFVFGLISSKMHMVWVKAIAGRIKTDFRYSAALCYNNFPIPVLTEKHKQMTQQYVFNVLEARERHSEKTMAQLYDPDKMPPNLREAHHQLDLAVELCYRSKPFENDEARLEYLFVLYEKMMSDESVGNGELVFETPNSKRVKEK